MADESLHRDYAPASGVDPVDERRVVRFAIVWSLACLAAFISSALWRAGALAPPVDDAYIYLQYAKRLATGHGFEYTDGNGPSTGATSYLYTALLAPGWWFGLRDRAYLLWPLLIGVTLLAVNIVMVFRVVRRLAPAAWSRTAGCTAVVAVSTNAYILWGAFSCMEIQLHSTLLLLAVHSLLTTGPASARTWITCAVISWARPEGAIIAGLGMLLFSGMSWTQPPLRRRLWFLWLMGIALVLVPSVLSSMLTGSPKTDGYAAKSVFAIPDSIGRDRFISMIPGRCASYVLAFLTDRLRPGFVFFEDARLRGGVTPIPVVVGCATGIGLLGGIVSIARGIVPAAAMLPFIWWFVGICLVSTTRFPIPRYFIAQVPLFWICITVGWSFVLSRITHTAVRRAFISLCAVCLVMTFSHTVTVWNAYGWNCENTEDQQTLVGKWLRANTPKDSIVAVNDAGAIAYYSDRPILDMYGLVSHGWAESMIDNPGAIYEKLDSLPASARPSYFAYYPEWYPDLAKTALMGRTVFEARLANNTINGSDLKLVQCANWDRPTDRHVPQSKEYAAGAWGKIVDRVNLADLRSEKAHGFSVTGLAPSVLHELGCDAAPNIKFADGGRIILGSIRATMHTTPGQDLHLVLRVHSIGSPMLSVHVGDHRVIEAPIHADRNSWHEIAAVVPKEFITSNESMISIAASGTSGGDEPFECFYIWALQ